MKPKSKPVPTKVDKKQNQALAKDFGKAMAFVACAFVVGGLLTWGYLTFENRQSEAASPTREVINQSKPVEIKSKGPTVSRQNRKAMAFKTDFDEQVEIILASDFTDAQKCAALIKLREKATPKQQEVLAGHVVDYSSGESYHLITEWLQEPEIPEPVADTLMADLLQQEDGTKLPALLQLAQLQSHPRSEDALELLEFHLDHDYGRDWKVWEQALQQHLH